MYYRGQPLSEIMSATFSEMKICYQWSEEIADGEEEANIKAKAKAGIKQ